MFFLNFYTRYLMKNVFLFTQGISTPLHKYEKKYSLQGSLPNGKVINEGACFAYVLFFIKYFEGISQNNNKQFFISIKNQLCDSKKIMPELYFWMGLQSLIYDKFKTENPHKLAFNPKKLSPEFQLKTAKLQKEAIYFNDLYDKLKKENVEYSFEIYKKFSEEKSNEFMRMYKQQTDRENYLINDIYLKRVSKFNELGKEQSEIHFGVNYLFNDGFSCGASYVLHRLFLERNAKNWNYIASISCEDSRKVIEYIRKFRFDFISKNQRAICFSFGIHFKNNAHQICILMTNNLNNPFLIFDPNYGLYKFTDFEDFINAFVCLTLHSYKTIKFEANILSLT